MRIARLLVMVEDLGGSLLAVFLLLACSSSATGPDPASEAKCRSLETAICDRVLACDATATRPACMSAISSSLDCGRAVGVSATYDRCLTELAAFDCAVFDGGATLPASCKDAVALAAN